MRWDCSVKGLLDGWEGVDSKGVGDGMKSYSCGSPPSLSMSCNIVRVKCLTLWTLTFAQSVVSHPVKLDQFNKHKNFSYNKLK